MKPDITISIEEVVNGMPLSLEDKILAYEKFVKTKYGVEGKAVVENNKITAFRFNDTIKQVELTVIM